MHSNHIILELQANKCWMRCCNTECRGKLKEAQHDMGRRGSMPGEGESAGKKKEGKQARG